MNSFYKVSNKIKEVFLANPDVHTIVFGRTSERDLYKKSIYPLVHINPLSSSFNTSSVNTFTFEIAVLDQRDLSRQTEADKYEGNDNEIDNLNLTHSIINRFISEFRLQNNSDEIEITNVTEATTLLMSGHNLLDGFYVNITFIIPNTMIDVC
jgi:hypothetical protein